MQMTRKNESFVAVRESHTLINKKTNNINITRLNL